MGISQVAVGCSGKVCCKAPMCLQVAGRSSAGGRSSVLTKADAPASSVRTCYWFYCPVWQSQWRKDGWSGTVGRKKCQIEQETEPQSLRANIKEGFLYLQEHIFDKVI